jgi:8-oxo-dGTP pyrophosphatase MutT (NUDIX family)
MAQQHVKALRASRNYKDQPNLTQLAALCWRRVPGQGREVLLVTSSTGRWILPKGWPIGGKPKVHTVMTEAWEEAGVKKGRAVRRPVGSYMATKISADGDELPCVHKVFAVEVHKTVDDYPESDRRSRIWVSPDIAVDLVQEDGLKEILRGF